jgi:hypothetical protein
MKTELNLTDYFWGKLITVKNLTEIFRGKTYKGKNVPDLKWPVLSRPTSGPTVLGEGGRAPEFL